MLSFVIKNRAIFKGKIGDLLWWNHTQCIYVHDYEWWNVYIVKTIQNDFKKKKNKKGRTTLMKS